MQLISKTNRKKTRTNCCFSNGRKAKIVSVLSAFFITIAVITFPAKADALSIPILGPPSATVEKAKSWAINHPRTPTEEFIDLADLYWKIAPEVGVDPAVAYAQFAHETGFGNFGGVIDATFHNPCGLKITAGGGNYDPDAHMRFPDWETGIRAHVDHLALYAGAPGYPDPNSPDPRHFPSLRGTAPTVEALGGKWAPSETYGHRVGDFVFALQYGVEIGMDQFVTRMYHAGLGRDVDPGGLAYWRDKLMSGAMTGATVAEHFLLSQEIENKGLYDSEYLQVIYISVLGRVGDASGMSFWQDQLKNGVSRTGVLRQFLLSGEFQRICNRYGIRRGEPTIYEARDENLNLATFINRQYQAIFDRPGDADGLNYWANLILHRNSSVEAVAGFFLNSEEFLSKNYGDEDYLKILYRAFMGRESDPGGMAHWTTLLQNGSGDAKKARQDIFEAFAYSEEFKNIILSYGLTPSRR